MGVGVEAGHARGSRRRGVIGGGSGRGQVEEGGPGEGASLRVATVRRGDPRGSSP